MLSLRKLIGRPINNITAAAALVALFSVASRFLGVVRDHILAGSFGAGAELDIYYAAFRVPDFIYNLIVLGALSAGFIPVFSEMIKRSEIWPGEKEKLVRLANNVFNSLLLLIILLSVFGVIFAAPVTAWITPGFSAEAKAQTAHLTRIMFLSPLFLGMSGVLGGILQSYKRFFVYSLSPVFYNLGIIFGALVLVDFWGIDGLAWGVVLGAVLHFAVQLPTVWSLGFHYRFLLDIRDRGLRQIAMMMGPRTLSLAVSQINLLAITALASLLDSGSLAVFNLANNLQSFPLGVFGISFAVAAFPFLSENAYKIEELKVRFSATIRQILFFIIPASVLLITLRAQLIRLVLGSGAFNWQDTILTMNTLGFFSLSLFAQASLPLLVRVFYARRDSLTPFYLGLFSVVLNIVCAWYLHPYLGVAGLALAFSIASIVNFLSLWIVLYFRVGSLDLDKILVSVLKFSVAAIGAGLVIQILKIAVWPFIDMTTFVGVFIQFSVAASGGVIAYICLCHLFRSEELLSAIAIFKKRLSVKKVKLADQGEARGL
ncbi:MAG TPA: murein biosynthesis integral membrane protein MurJ [bacterium]|nr:MAG: putative peptidoglycan biosynthesis protein MurJ [Parcubacteria group bacterium ADurb.Bin115]HNU81216.1 murein biosynthesis integral membrane protein MurJ [bacterium]